MTNPYEIDSCAQVERYEEEKTQYYSDEVACKKFLYEIIVKANDDLDCLYELYCIQDKFEIRTISKHCRSLLNSLKLFFNRDCEKICAISMGSINPEAIKNKELFKILAIEHKWKVLEEENLREAGFERFLIEDKQKGVL